MEEITEAISALVGSDLKTDTSPDTASETPTEPLSSAAAARSSCDRDERGEVMLDLTGRSGVNPLSPIDDDEDFRRLRPE